MNANDQLALLGYAEMLDDTVEVPGMHGGEPVRILMNEVQRLEVEIVHLKIAHLRRMADRADMLATTAEMPYYARFEKKRIAQRLRRFHVACLAKIAELKALQR